jgi:protein phosphatase
MGTTLLAAYRPSSPVLWIIHVGDCRAYRLRGARLRQLTEDHTIYNQVRKSRHVAGEIIDPALMRQLSQSLGSSEFIAPQIVQMKLEAGDRYLLCTDGLFDMLTDTEICALFAKTGSPEQICRSLVESANQRGGKDNITVIVLDCQG